MKPHHDAPIRRFSPHTAIEVPAPVELEYLKNGPAYYRYGAGTEAFVGEHLGLT